MKKVFIIHGFEGSPNGGWRPWLMGELEKMDVYACALPMPAPDQPICSEWVEEISRYIESNHGDETYLVGHSLGVPAILRYLEASSPDIHIAGAVLVSGPVEDVGNKEIAEFFEPAFDFEAIKRHSSRFAIIQGDNDPYVPSAHAEILAERLGGELTIIPNGKHLNGSAGWLALPQALDALKKMFA